LRILIAAGGTGGHVYPALAAAEALTRLYPEVKLSFIGGVGGFERPLIAEAGIQFDSHDEVRSGPLHGVSRWQQAKSVVQLALGTLQSFRIIGRLQPGVLLLTGGWEGFPAALAGWLRRVPILIYLPDIEPGLTIRVMSRLAREIALTVEDSRAYFPGKRTVVTGYPVRPELRKATRGGGLVEFKLDPARRTLLVFGGSRGSRAINYALLDILPELLQSEIQVIHITGTLDWPDIEARRKAMPDVTHYHAFPYLHHEMGLALAAADLVVCRAGASVLGEFPLFGLPSILIPLAYAWRYQQVNADYLAARGAAVHLDEKDMQAQLLPTIERILNDAERLAAMKASSAALSTPDGADRLAGELVKLAGGTA
jgi:undecaprenyldiphospho-muramoylpentapeptide beta-N-acetylglucosaminyltransferase